MQKKVLIGYISFIITILLLTIFMIMAFLRLFQFSLYRIIGTLILIATFFPFVIGSFIIGYLERLGRKLDEKTFYHKEILIRIFMAFMFSGVIIIGFSERLGVFILIPILLIIAYFIFSIYVIYGWIKNVKKK